ncbi:hypothetical protein [Plantactinospora endophytica]|uniref:YtkA-like domain-containing protein n=1 Tax=Plantactinospora endophytica TaxID=673535 RepID=A0ABQ4E4L6_9ACTN|nr:hypothetical protein [Plantactinospora endophytica]GIG89646.1 hypothetical protein Pen02_45820 [Plantactinospora endophytica]
MRHRPSTAVGSTAAPAPATRSARRIPGLRALVPLLCALFLAAGLAPAAPAAAHGDKIKLLVAGDGATGVTVQASYQDGHPLDNGVRLVLTATGEGGRTLGPLQLNPAGEGEGFYSTGPVLTPGSWQVTVTAPKPTPASVQVVVQARAAQAAPPPRAAAAPEPAGTSTTWLWWVAGAAVALAAVATLGALLVRTRTRRP